MAAIDIGTGALDLASDFANFTAVDQANPANLSGALDHLDVYLKSYISGTLEMATFFVVAGNNLSTRGVATGLTPAAGDNNFDAPGDFTAFAVNAGDYLGCYFPGTISMEYGSTGSGIWYTSAADNVPCTNVTFTVWAGKNVAIGGTGLESVAGYKPQIMIFF